MRRVVLSGVCRAFDNVDSLWNAVQDGFEQMNGLGEHLKERLQIQFVDVHGIPEAGVDGGGLFKDFMENLVKQGFDPQLGLFLATSDNRLYPNPNASLAMEQAVPAFEFLGKMVGKAMYEVCPPPKT